MVILLELQLFLRLLHIFNLCVICKSVAPVNIPRANYCLLLNLFTSSVYYYRMICIVHTCYFHDCWRHNMASIPCSKFVKLIQVYRYETKSFFSQIYVIQCLCPVCKNFTANQGIISVGNTTWHCSSIEHDLTELLLKAKPWYKQLPISKACSGSFHETR